MKRLSLTFLFIAIFSYLFSNFYLPKYYLDDFKPVENNSVDIYSKYAKNLTLFKENFCFLNKLNIQKKVEPDYETRYIKISYQIRNKYDLIHPVFLTEQEYANGLFKSKFKSLLKSTFKEYLEQKNRDTGGGLIKDIVLKIPKYAMPKAVEKFLGGNEAARLRLNGSQDITFSGKDTKTKNKSYNEGLANRNFSLKMHQNLDLNLHGTIGKKIFVNVSHKTASDMQQGKDNVDIHYQGLEDEIVKFVKAGDMDKAGGQTFSSAGNSISSSGLFGVRADFQIGQLSLNTIIAKDKTQKNVQTFNPKASSKETIKSSRDFSKNYFYIDNPYNLYEIYNEQNAPDEFPEWANNAFVFNEYGQWIIKNPGLLPAPNTTIHVFVDDDNANNDQLTVCGRNWSDPADTTTYHFDELIKGTDFTYDETTGLIILTNEVQRQYTIGIVYTRNDGMQVGNTDYDENDPTSYIQVKLIKKKNQDKNTDTWLYQCRNIYDLGMRGMSPEGFELKVFNYNSDNTQNYYYHGNVNYIRFLHLDTNGDGIVNGDETTIDLTNGRIIIPMIYPFYALGDSIIYEKSNLTPSDETIMNLFIRGKIKNDIINLEAFNLVKNSVVVKLNGQKLKPNIDYIVDYDMGTITLLNTQAMNSLDKITVEYEEIPLFSLENKTLIAAQASIGNKSTDNFYMNAMLGYQSEKVKEERPKIGGENRSIFLSGIETGYKLDMPFLTKLVDKLPIINTDQASNLSIKSSLSLSVPHIYGSSKQPYKNEAYVEDMESSLETMSLGVTRRLWVPASKPYQLDFHKAEINWFVLSTWRAEDVYDNLSEDERREKIPVMTLKVIPDSLNQGEYWGGLMKYLGNQIDLSDKDFIELMIRPEETMGDVNVHIDLGAISEDFYTDYGGEGILNTEDGKNGGARNGTLDVGEDVGLDGLKDSEEDEYDSSTNKDPHRDNFDNKKVNNEYPYINRTENNSELDTEDLNSNGRLDVENVYFEFSFPLSEISQWYVSDTHSGFKYFRIPINDFTDIISSSGEVPELDKIEYIRLWFDVSQKSKFNIAFFNIVGNKWEKLSLKDEESGDNLTGHDLDPDENFRIGTTDTQKDPHYVQPKQTKIKTHKETLEQSVYADFNSLKQNHLALIWEKLSSTEESMNSSSGINLTGYKKLRFLVYAENKEDQPPLEDEHLHLYFRICYDSLTYYEIFFDSLKVNPYDAVVEDGIAKMKRSYWKQFEIDFSDLTKAKSSLMYANGDSIITTDKYRIRIAHSKTQWPTLTNVKMLIFGISPTQENFNGRVYFDDIRVVGPIQESGYKFDTSVIFNFAGLSKFTLSYNYQTPNFINSASRKTKFSNKKHHRLSFSTNWYLGKFFPAEWGISLPFTFSKENTFDKHIYKQNTDISIEDLPDEEKEKQKYITDNYSISLDYSMNKTPRSKILEYSLKKSKIYLDHSKNYSISPTKRDTTINYSAKYIYDLDIPEEAIDIKLWKNYRFYFFPNRFTNTYTYNDNYTKSWNYITTDDTTGWRKDTSKYPTKTLETINGIKYKMFSDLSFNYQLTTRRDLYIKNYFKKIPIGVEKSRGQDISASFQPSYTDKIFTFSVSPSVTYNEEHKKVGLADTLYYFSRVQRSISVSSTIKNSDLINSLANLIDRALSPKNKENKEKKEDKETKNEKYENEKYENEKYEEENNQYHNSNEKELEFNKTEEKNNFGDKYNNNNKGRSNYRKKAENTKMEHMLAKFINYFSKISNISFNYSNGYGTNTDRLSDRPAFAYQLGIPNILPDTLLTRQEFIDNYSFSGSVSILDGLNTNWRYEWRKTETWDQTKNYNISRNFPNLSLSFARLNTLFHIEEIIESTNLNTSYSFTRDETGKIDDNTPQRIKFSYRMDPLLSWRANWKYGIGSEFNLKFLKEKEITNNAANQIVKYSLRKEASFKLNWSFSAPSGIDVPLLKRIHFKNELKPSLNLTYVEEKTYNKSDEKHPERWTKNLNIQPSANYEFNKSITGSLSMSYDLKRNLKDNSSVRDFTLAINVNIKF